MDQNETSGSGTSNSLAKEGIRKRITPASGKSTSNSEEPDKKPHVRFTNGFIESKVVSNGISPENSEEEEEEEEEDDDGDDEEEEEEEESEDKSETEKSSPVGTQNSHNISNVLDDDEDGENTANYDYNEFDYEYIPKIREPPSDEDSEDGLLVSKSERDAALSGIAKALLQSAKTNQEAYEREREERNSISGFDGFIHCCGGSGRLLKLEEMPPHLQFNKFVHTGYRDIQDAWGCFLSLFYLHNETVNILTHVAPIVYILLFWRSMYPWQDIEGNTFLNVLGWSHIIASVAPWTGSVVYHTFMSLNKGEQFYQFLLQIDMFGIWVTECFGALTNLTAATWCLPRNLQNYIMVAYGLAAVWGLQKALSAWTPLARRMCFAPVFISRILAFILRVSAWGGGDSSILIHVILQDFVSVIGGMIGVIRVPEKWFPGKLDIFINSHHIMHVLVVVAVIHMNLASNGDIRWIINNYSQAQCFTPL